MDSNEVSGRREHRSFSCRAPQEKGGEDRVKGGRPGNTGRGGGGVNGSVVPILVTPVWGRGRMGVAEDRGEVEERERKDMEEGREAPDQARPRPATPPPGSGGGGCGAKGEGGDVPSTNIDGRGRPAASTTPAPL